MSDALHTLDKVDVKDLPPLAQELVALIGFSATLRLVEKRPGIPAFIPKVLTPDHWLLDTLGQQQAEALVKHYGGETITVPNCKLAMVKIRQRRIVQTRADGFSQTEAALLHGVTPRWVRELESRDPEPDRNLSLF
ncbi:MAG: Mor transcription activator family protein [Gallionella sp.]|nr:Mor transcription activator family protein [Gallionella sp.]MDD4947198.1 Mor transcription activator family protein [Gallionella sp.]MDD5613361.1 Mor transcription activator family protein [Gallionella sp.]